MKLNRIQYVYTVRFIVYTTRIFQVSYFTTYQSMSFRWVSYSGRWIHVKFVNLCISTVASGIRTVYTHVSYAYRNSQNCHYCTHFEIKRPRFASRGLSRRRRWHLTLKCAHLFEILTRIQDPCRPIIYGLFSWTSTKPKFRPFKMQLT